MSATTRSSSQWTLRRWARRSQAGVVTALSLLALIALIPYLFMLFTSFKTNEQLADSYFFPSWPLHPENYVVAWQQIQPYFVTSLAVAAISLVVTLALATIAAFAISQYRFPGRSFFYTSVALLLMIPSISSLIPLFLLVRDLQLLNTLIVLTVPHITASTVLAIILIKNYVDDLPDSLFEAARVDGATATRIFFSIALPLARPVIGTVALITLINVWNDFFWPLLTVTENSLRNVAVGVSFFQGQNITAFGPLFAGYALASLPLLILFVFLSKYFLAGLAGGIITDR